MVEMISMRMRTVTLFLTVTFSVVWSYIVMHMGYFAPDVEESLSLSSNLALYSGYAAVALAMIVVPRAFSQIARSPQALAAVALFMVLAATVKSFSYAQTLFDPTLPCALGGLMVGMSYSLAICIVYPMVFDQLGPVCAGVVVIGAHLLKRLASPLLDNLNIGVYTLILAYGIPMVVAALAYVALREGRGTPKGTIRDATQSASRANVSNSSSVQATALVPVLVLCTAGIALAACDMSDVSGVWSTAQGARSPAPTELLTEAVFVCILAVLLLPFRGAPLDVRYAPLFALAVAPSAVMSALPPSGGNEMAGILAIAAVVISTFFHGAVWIVTFACIHEKLATHRAMGIVLFVSSAAGIGSLTLGAGFTQGPPVLAVALCVATLVLCLWTPVVGAVANAKQLRRGANNPSGAVRKGRQDTLADKTDVPDSDSLKDTLQARCAEIAEWYGLSERELDVLILLVEGWSRKAICETLGISEGTAKTHASHIYGKIGIPSRQDLADIVFGRGEGRQTPEPQARTLER